MASKAKIKEYAVNTKELELFKNIYSQLDDNHKVFAEKLYKELVFMSGNLDELKNNIKENGAILHTVNGNGFEVITENPAQKSYNSMIKNYNLTVKQLSDLAPVKKAEKSKLQLMRDE